MNRNMKIVGAYPSQRRATFLRPGCGDKYVRVPECGMPLLRLEVVSSHNELQQGLPHNGRMRLKKLVPSPCRPGVVSRLQQGLPHSGRMRLKKIVHGKGKNRNTSLRFGSWNIGSLTGRLVELVEVMRRRKINIMCLQETKWVGQKAKEVAPWGYKLWYSGTS